MLDLVKKGLYIGLGLASMTKDKIEAVAKELAENAKMPEEEGRKLAKALHEESQKAKENLRTTVEAMVEAAAKKLPCCKRYNDVVRRLDALEAAAGIKTETKPGCESCTDDGTKD